MCISLTIWKEKFNKILFYEFLVNLLYNECDDFFEKNFGAEIVVENSKVVSITFKIFELLKLFQWKKV